MRAIGALVSATRPADVITVFEQLQSHGKAEECGGLVYLNALAQSVPSAANLRRYAEIVRERAVLRKLVATSDDIATAAFNPQGRQVSQILDEAEGKIFRIGEEGSRSKQGLPEHGPLVVQLIDRVNELHENGAEDVTGVRTGFYDLTDDRRPAAGRPDHLAARPSMGKTAFALNIGENVAVNEGLPVVVFSMEMGAQQLALRMVGLDGPHRPAAPAHRPAARRRLGAAVGGRRQAGQGQHVHRRKPGAEPSEVRARARRRARQCGGSWADHRRLPAADERQRRRRTRTAPPSSARSRAA